MPAALLLAFALAAPARAASTGTARLALLEYPGVHASMTIGGVLARLIKESSGTVVSEQTLPCYYSSGDYRFRIPNAQAEFSTSSAILFDSDSEAELVYPPDPEFVARLRALARDPATYDNHWSLRLETATASLSEFETAAGETILTAQLHPEQGESAQWHTAVAALYRVRWKDRELSVLGITKVFGGLGRLATSVRATRERGTFVGVAREGVFGDELTDLRGPELADALAGLGLKVSGVGGTELRRWPELAAYREKHPDGVQFVATNLVYSSAPAVTLLPDHVVVESGGLKIAIMAVTNPYESKYFKQGGLKGVEIMDPLQAVESRVAKLRAEADAVVLLADLSGPAEQRLRGALGVDVVIGEEEGYPSSAPPPDAEVSQLRRGPFDPPLWVSHVHDAALNLVELSVNGDEWRLSERHRRLDDTVQTAPGFREFDPESFGIKLSTSAPLIPAARRLYGVDLSTSSRIDSQKVWTMAASMLADRTHSEAALLRVWDLRVEIDDDVPESVVRVWLRSGDPALVYYLRGSKLKALIAEAQAQKDREDRGLPIGDQIRFTYAGLDKDGKLHGAAIDDGDVYKVATSQILAEALGLSSAGGDPRPTGKNVDELVLEGLEARRDSPDDAYRSWMAGRPASDAGFWKVNFRDVGLTLNQTKVVRSDDFNGVPNSRIQGFDQLTVGYTFKADADYLHGPYKWSNTLEMEYARTRVAPRGQPVVTNTTANRIMGLTTGTRRAGAIPQKWLAQSWGPSLGFEYDGQFQADPGLRRKNIYSALPGLQFYDGTFVRTLEVSGNIKRDESRDPANTQGGLHFRTLFSKGIGQTAVTGAPIDVQGEIYTNYFFLTHTDTAQDLRVEGDANLKLKIPIRKYLTIAPFIDYYFFEWKLAPIWGYSAMTGVQIGFSRLWKPQYEPLLGL